MNSKYKTRPLKQTGREARADIQPHMGIVRQDLFQTPSVWGTRKEWDEERHERGKNVNSKQQKKGDRERCRAESTAALSLCLLIQTPQENAPHRLLSLAKPSANHSSRMQGAFRLFPTPKYERERERKRGLWCRGSFRQAELLLSCIL